ncbi:alpha/beta fold hydrolase [Pararhodobacter zhoushanensis]|uniref:alpha/beta fold hydrolase n=1 Tax=Pararhodobacter zhoushanensis TaxID=2479545 RepID=UPI0013DF4311|nr:alpha/beta hydrolase [Pararhodobacter zhoushanensis]
MLQLVCLPGLLCDAGIYAPVLADLAMPAQSLDLPALDSFEALVEQITAQLPEQAVLVGMSMGSYLALAVARRAPERVKGLVLIGTNAAADTPRGAALRGKVAAWAAREGIDALAASIADGMLSTTRRDDADLRGAILRMATGQGLDTFTRHQTALAARPDQTAALADITCPVLVLTGAEDTVTPPDAGRAVAEGVPQGQFILLDGIGHMPVLERPDLVAQHIRAFVTTRLPQEERAQ